MKKTTRTGVILTKKLNYNYVPRQNFPGKFKIVEYNASEKPVTGSGKPAKNHETYHKNLQETATGKIYGGFTSNPKPGQNNYHYVSKERLDGKTTGQWFGLYNNPKVITEPQIVKNNPQLQAYADANEAKLQSIIQSKKTSVCLTGGKSPFISSFVCFWSISQRKICVLLAPSSGTSYNTHLKPNWDSLFVILFFYE